MNIIVFSPHFIPKMKKLSELMKDIGFNPHASDSVKEAFVKHLIKQSVGIHVQTPSEKKVIAENPEKFIAFKKLEKYALPIQLTFEFENEDHMQKKKVAT